MDTFNLKDAADQSLRLLEQSGVSAKAVKEYLNHRFWCHHPPFHPSGYR